MTPELCFQILQWLAIAGWVPLAVAPRWRLGPRLISGVLVPALLAACYSILLLIVELSSSSGGEGSFGSLALGARMFNRLKVHFGNFV